MKSGKITALLLVLGLLVSSFAAASSEIQYREDELKKVQQSIQSLDSAIREKEDSKKQIVNDVNALNNSIRNLDSEITSLDDEIAAYEGDIRQKEMELEETSTTLEEKKAIFYERLRVMYKSKNVGYFEIVFGAKDFEDLLTRIDMIRLLVAHDTDLIEVLGEEIKHMENLKTELEAAKVSLEASKADLKVKQDRLNEDVGVLETKKVQLNKDLKALEDQVDRLNSDADQLTSIIANLKLQQQYVGGEMAWPAPGVYRITSPFGYRIHPILNIRKLHTGVDIGTPMGTTIVAAQSGDVIYSDWYGGYGLVVMIDHGGGIVTLYGHNSKLLVKVGKTVTKGDPISLSGTTGLSTGPHLHFEVREDGNYVDPLTYVTAQ
ncbi:MAG: hypothetical protein AVO33_05645 [delta proteobacterium ML8_F1]|nr:MAG: hypothetical protein AVO33_05645 [delta proteobacterium ML8_F1]